MKFHLLCQRALLPLCLTAMTLQVSQGISGDEPRRLDAPRSGVRLLPPEAIEVDTDGGEQQPVPSPVGQSTPDERTAMRDPVVDRKGAMTRPLAPRFDETQTSLLVICAGVAAGGFWIAFMQSRSSDVAKSAVWKLSSDIDLLKPLVANTLVIMEEVLMLPQSARLHGRPMANDRLRVDGAQPLADPHFIMAPVAPSSAPVDGDAIHWVSAAEAEVRQPTFQRLSPDLPERASISLDKEFR